MNLSAISTHWLALHEALGLGAPIADEARYEQTLAVVGQLFDAVAAEPDGRARAAAIRPARDRLARRRLRGAGRQAAAQPAASAGAGARFLAPMEMLAG